MNIHIEYSVAVSVPATLPRHRAIPRSGCSRKRGNAHEREEIAHTTYEGDPAETTTALRELYPESQDGLELTIVSTIPTLIAMLEIVNPESSS